MVDYVSFQESGKFRIGEIKDSTVEVIKLDDDGAVEWRRWVGWVEGDTTGDAIEAAIEVGNQDE